MKAIKLDKRIRLEKRLSVFDDLGQPQDAWALLDEVWANIRYKSGVGAIRSDADVSVVQVSIKIRNRSDLDIGMRAVHSANAFDIKAILPDSADPAFIYLVCERVT